MTIRSEINTGSFHNVIKIMDHILNALGAFKDKYDKKFNFSELSKHLKIPNSEIEAVIELVLNFQSKFDSVFKDYSLEKKVVDKKVYLITREKQEHEIQETKEIIIKKNQAKLLSDIIYTFQHIKRGKGFDLTSNYSDLTKNIEKLEDDHPYLFHHNGSNLTYPSELGMQLGNAILSYNKLNKKINTMMIGKRKVIFD